MNTQNSMDLFKIIQDSSFTYIVNIKGKGFSDRLNFPIFCPKICLKPELNTLCQQYTSIEQTDLYQNRNFSISRNHDGLEGISIPAFQNNQLIGFVSIEQIELKNVTEDILPHSYPITNCWKPSPELSQSKSTDNNFSKNQFESDTSLVETTIGYDFKNTIFLNQINLDLLTNKEEIRNTSISKKTDISEALTYIDKNFASDLTIKDVADHVYLSQFHFSRMFKKESGINFNTYLNKKRIEKAKILLTQSDLCINIISKKIGYTRTSYFCKVFRSFVGMTPTKYRKNIMC
ncbi:helix-turn-helix domain-containing protein [Enterococcus hulanensis]|uniref:helix-turn-helix domain-containing protein n=1 Tax=Enterococcus hulanensis TaxID=2559929 RepID=UPI0010F5AFD5|nr:helix-turn-helix domain-containing protein [Enterococcus hulanensis]